MICGGSWKLLQDLFNRLSNFLGAVPELLGQFSCLFNETFEKVATYGLLANMITYLIGKYHMSIPKGANVLFIWTAVTNFVPLFGAFLSDSSLGRFRTIIYGSIVSLLGMTLLWSTAMIPGVQPKSGESASSSQLALLFGSFILMSIGSGGIRPCSLAFGADQLAPLDNQKKSTVLQSFFNWYYVSVGVSIMIALTVIVYIQDHKGWKLGLGVPACMMLFSAVIFLVGSPLYVMVPAKKSLFTGLAQVIVAATRNRHLDLPSQHQNGCHYHSGGSDLIAPTDRLRYLNKACIIINPQKDLNVDGSALNPWNLCTVEQVEELKSLIRLMPMWSTGIIIALTISQHSFGVVQANTMDRHLSPHFEIPGGSFGIFTITTLTVWIAIYDRAIVPFVRKFTGRPRGISLKQRMGTGLLISILAMAVSAMVESFRRRRAIEQGLSENWTAQVNMTAMWLVPQYSVIGLAEAFSAIGQIEFYYSELPPSMSSLAVALFTFGMGVGNLVGAAVVEIVGQVSKEGRRESWVADNLNKGHYDYYYWVLTAMSCVNFGYFLLCSWAYGPTNEDLVKVVEGEDVKEEG